ncbi:hypothetical protein ACVR0P_01095 [Streptococcus castoreus]|uniref:hypothetical protein n=1 Tax=Streptococcus castoreus TaxID=254786 RepID=UPI00041F40CE|nr:hypothetical protein [Streptococcus castoreus]
MISYEKVRQALKTSTIVIIILNAISIVLSLIGFAGIFFLQSQLKNETFRSQFTTEQLAQLEASLSPFMIFISVLNLIAIVVILVFCAQNLSNLKKKLVINYVPYILGLVLCIVGLATSLFLAPKTASSSSLIFTVVLTLAQAALYGFAFYKAKTLNEKESDNDQTIL